MQNLNSAMQFTVYTQDNGVRLLSYMEIFMFPQVRDGKYYLVI